MELLDKHFKTVKSNLAARPKLYSTIKEDTESVADLTVRVKSLASH